MAVPKPGTCNLCHNHRQPVFIATAAGRDIFHPRYPDRNLYSAAICPRDLPCHPSCLSRRRCPQRPGKLPPSPDRIVSVLLTALFQLSARQSLPDALRSLIKQLCKSAFLGSPECDQLLQKLQDYYPLPQDDHALAILMDADNLRLSVDEEEWIANQMGGRFRLRAAFANWREKRGVDQELHRRYYELHHAPPDKNGADFCMMLFGKALPYRHPEIHKIVVCSNDLAFDNVVRELNQTSLQVYSLTKKGKMSTSIY